MNVRADSWAAKLSEDQAWELFYKSRKCDWQVAAKWAKREFKLESVPSRSAFYSWKKQMQEEEHTHKMAQALIAQQEAKSIAANYNVTDEDSVKALMSAATNATILADDPKLAYGLIETAMMVKDRQLKEIELRQKKEEQKVREEYLKLSREKFEFSAAREAMKHVEEIREISKNDKLDADEKIAKVREALFGKDAKESK